MKILIAVYKDEKYKVLKSNETDFIQNRQLQYHTLAGARIAIVEFSYDKLPELNPVFGKGLVVNETGK